MGHGRTDGRVGDVSAEAQRAHRLVADKGEALGISFPELEGDQGLDVNAESEAVARPRRPPLRQV